MKDDKEKEQELLEKLDRILQGREDGVTEPEDEDTRTALEFARKMASMRDRPSDDFTKKLKAELTHRLAEQEEETETRDPELLFWGITRRRLWQGTLAALAAVIIAAIIFVIVLLTD